MNGRGVGGVRRSCVCEDRVVWQCEGKVKGVKTIWDYNLDTTTCPSCDRQITVWVYASCKCSMPFYQPTPEIFLHSGWYNQNFPASLCLFICT